MPCPPTGNLFGKRVIYAGHVVEPNSEGQAPNRCVFRPSGPQASPALPADKHLELILGAIDAQITGDNSIDAILETLDASRVQVYESLRDKLDPLAAKSVTIKILNLFLSKYHFLARSTILLSSPFGIVVDPSNNCQLACPGCVHSVRSKQLRIFDWPSGMLSESMFADFMRRHGPCAIQASLYNYGEPLLNLNTPRLIRIAKTYLVRTTLSTNMGVKHFDSERYVMSGLDFMVVCIDGVTQDSYKIFRQQGQIEAVFNNVRSLIQTRTRLGKRTPVVRWQYLAFEHNEQEIDDAIMMAQHLGFDQFALATPFDVGWDHPNIRPSKVAPRVVSFSSDCGEAMIENWNPFPSEIEAGPIEHEFSIRWRDRYASARPPRITGNQASSRQHTCHHLYKNIVMDAKGRIMPCCGAPKPDAALIFGDSKSGTDHFNSESYRLARLSFASPEMYQIELASIGHRPHCATCEWDQDKAQIDKEQVCNYFDAIGNDVLNKASIAILSAW